MERLERRLDRLEEFFSRKKKKAPFSGTVGLQSPSTTPISLSQSSVAVVQTFPRPSFIKPTSSRMVARDEVAFGPNSTGRAQSLPESSSSRRLMPLAARAQGGKPNIELPEGCPQIPERLSSLRPSIPQRSSSLSRSRTKNAAYDQLLDFGFPTRPKSRDNSPFGLRSRSSTKSGPRSTSVSVSPKAQANRKRRSSGVQDETSVSQPHPTRVKRCLVQQYKPSDSARLQQDSKYQRSGRHGNHTSQLSPTAAAVSQPGPGEVDNSNAQKPQRPRSMCASVATQKPTLRISTSLPALATPATGRFILKEPSLEEFMALSDDDIAGDRAAPQTEPSAPKAPGSAAPPNVPPAVPPRRHITGCQLVTPSPPLASRPAAAAALEAARIAVKYKFDLVYVVNLWPAYMSHSQHPSRSTATTPPITPTGTSTPSPPSSPVSNTSSGEDSLFGGRTPPLGISSRTRSCGMTGRLLAAYGLHSIMCPFQISAPVHQKVLQTQGWLEYHNENTGLAAPMDQFARGYSCSFYTGYSPDRRDEQQQLPLRGRGTRGNGATAANRGVVFAAFRLPRQDGTSIDCTAAELAALHKEAEFLVDLLIDINMIERKRRAVARRGVAI